MKNSVNNIKKNFIAPPESARKTPSMIAFLPNFGTQKDKNAAKQAKFKYFIEYQYTSKLMYTNYHLPTNCLSSTYQDPTNSYRSRSW